jgi:hypothetical protein
MLVDRGACENGLGAMLEGCIRRAGLWKARNSSFLLSCTFTGLKVGRGAACARGLEVEAAYLSPCRARRGRESMDWGMDTGQSPARHLHDGSNNKKL